jgi:5-methyltetrahydrofolate--homocysteine methyltransferase
MTSGTKVRGRRIPQVIQNIYRQYLEIGGSNIIGTNTFSSTTIAMADYDMQR